MPTPQEIFSFELAVGDFDLSLLPPHARQPGTDAFSTEVGHVLEREYQPFGGHVRIVVDEKVIRVTWTQDPHQPKPLEAALNRLQQGDHAQGVAMLRTLLRQTPDSPPILYGLGMGLSDLNQLDEAERFLRRLVQLDPSHVDGLVALGVVLARKGDTESSIAVLQNAVEADPENPWAHRNLGGCLHKIGQSKDGERHLRLATELNPKDAQAWWGLAQAAQANGDMATAAPAYLRVVELDPYGQLGEMARQEGSNTAHDLFKGKVGGGLRMDAVMYCANALRKFRELPVTDVQRITFEVARLGRTGLDTNNAAAKYTLRSLPGNYSGLHLVCLMYVGFKILAPEQDIGFDLSKEYEAAQAMS
jgi:Flp pilus assembly protein TadD